MPSEMLSHALAYAELGWRVFPVRGKTPLTPHGLLDATTDTSTIRDWWRRFPDAGIGVRPGADWICVDLDGAAGLAAFAALEREHGALPVTPRSTTGGGGKHILLRASGIKQKVRWADGCDTRTDRGYFVAPPSPHPSGACYSWDVSPWDAAIAECPPWLLGKLTKLAVAATPPPPPRRGAPSEPAAGDEARARSALAALDPDCDHDTWIHVGMALHSCGEAWALAVWDDWSRGGAKWKEGECAKRWRSFRGEGRTMDTLWKLARTAGWKPDEELHRRPARQLPEPPPEEDTGWADAYSATEPVTTAKGRPPPKTQPACSEWCTDLGNAKRFAAQWKDSARYCGELGWVIYDGRRWARASEGVKRLAIKTAESILREADEAPEDAREGLRRWAAASQSAAKIHGMLELSRPLLECSIEDFDRHHHLLNCANGTVDLRTGELLPHDPQHMLMKLCRVDYRPDVQPGRWASFCAEVLPDDELRTWVLRGLGYSLTGVVGEQCFFLCVGDGADGKSTMLNGVSRVLGDYAASVSFDALLASTHVGGCDIGIEAMRGARLVVCGEPRQGVPLAEGTVKTLTGGDRVNVNPKHRTPYSFAPTHKIWAMANTAPTIRGQDHGIWRRVRRVPYEQRFDVCLTIEDELWSAREEILSSLVARAVEWHEKGLGICDRVLLETQAYREQCDPVGRFVADCCEVGEGLAVRAGELRKAYEDWCADNGEEEYGENKYGHRLLEKGFLGGKRAGVRMRLGLRLASKPTTSGDQVWPFAD